MARHNCSASIARASRCGQVALPKASSRSAAARGLVVEAVGAADQEARLAPAVVAPLLELLRASSDRAQLLAFLVEQDGDAVVGAGPAACRRFREAR